LTTGITVSETEISQSQIQMALVSALRASWMTGKAPVPL